MSKKETCGDKPICEPKPIGHLEANLPSSKRNKAGDPVLHLGLQRRSLTPLSPESQEPNITGRYEDEGGNFTLHVNHCGNYLYVYYAQARTAATASRTTISYSGLRVGDGFFVLRPHSQEHPGGSLTLEGNRLVMNFGGPAVPLTRITDAPVFSEFSMRGASERFRNAELHPLTTSQRKRLEAAFDPARVRRWLDGFFAGGTTTSGRLRRQKMLEALEEWVGNVFSTAPPHGIHPGDLIEFQLLARAHLRRHHHRVGGAASESLYTLLQRAVVEGSAENSGFLDVRMHHIPRHLGIHARATSKIVAALWLGGYQGRSAIPFVDVTYMRGTLTLTQVTEPTWSAEYPVYVSGVGSSVSGPIKHMIGSLQVLETSGTAESNSIWRLEDVPGHILFGDFGLSAGAAAEGGAAGVTEMVIFGNELHPEPLSIDFSGFAHTARLAGFGISGTVCYGQIYPPKNGKNAPERVGEAVDLNEELKVSRAVHFRMGDAWLTPAGRDLVGELCAAELRSLRSPSSEILVEAHADRVDSRPRNDELTNLRAENVKRRIQEVVGDGFQVENVRTRGFGETEAAQASEPDGSPNPLRRRADVTVNGHIKLRLWAADAD